MWARIRHEWTDGQITELEVGSDIGAYPDQAAECVARVLDMWRVTCANESDE
jgi:hypothetical protein